MTPPLKPKILIAEDELSLRTILKNLLLKKGYEVTVCADGSHALAKTEQESFDLLLLDINLPALSGLEILSQLEKKKDPNRPIVILMTAEETLKNALEAMKRGAFDYLSKPFELEEIELAVERGLEKRKLIQEIIELKQNKKSPLSSPKLVGQSKKLIEIYKLIGKFSLSDLPVLITGESGTGKELVARLIHQSSNRHNFPFIAVNCAAIPKDLLESELFGYRKGAFTGADESRQGYFEAAHKGTLFLDEIGDMPPSLQGKLLRVLQEKEVTPIGSRESRPVDVRVLSATHQNLSEKINQKEFREDLFFRLNVLPLYLPPLRERKEDIPFLIEHFFSRFHLELNLPSKQFTPDAMELLKNYPWPGNVRELENLIKRTLVFHSHSVIQKEEILPFLGEKKEEFSKSQNPNENLQLLASQIILEWIEAFSLEEEENLYQKILEKIEEPLLSILLEKTKGNQIQTAKILGINRNTLRKKMRSLNIHVNRFENEVEKKK